MRFSIRHFEFEKAGVLPHYVPQLMMEMLCVGHNCQSAVMIRQSATTGALVLRIKRDDAWIDEMLYWLNRFQTDFVEREVAPPENFSCTEPWPIRFATINFSIAPKILSRKSMCLHTCLIQMYKERWELLQEQQICFWIEGAPCNERM